MSDDNISSRLSRSVQTGANTFYADTGSAGGTELLGADELLEIAKNELAATLAASGEENSSKVKNIRSTGNDNGQEQFEKLDARDPKLDELEQALINFLSRKKDVENMVAGGFRRIRSLRFDVNTKEVKPFFTVQVGVCEAAFNVENGLKERGSCFGLERFVRDWYEMSTTASDIKKYVEDKSKRGRKQKA